MSCVDICDGSIPPKAAGVPSFWVVMRPVYSKNSEDNALERNGKEKDSKNWVREILSPDHVTCYAPLSPRRPASCGAESDRTWPVSAFSLLSTTRHGRPCHILWWNLQGDPPPGELGKISCQLYLYPLSRQDVLLDILWTLGTFCDFTYKKALRHPDFAGLNRSLCPADKYPELSRNTGPGAETLSHSLIYDTKVSDALVTCLSSDCYNKYSTDWAACTQRGIVSHSSRSCEVQDQGTSKFSVWLEPASWFLDGYLLAVTSCWGRSEGTVQGLSYKGTYPIHKGSTIMN